MLLKHLYTCKANIVLHACYHYFTVAFDLHKEGMEGKSSGRKQHKCAQILRLERQVVTVWLQITYILLLYKIYF
jgi:hypothetical protein